MVGDEDAPIRPAEETLRQQNRILKSIVENIGEGLVVADGSGKFVLSNPAAERILRFDPTTGPLDQWENLHGYQSYLPDMVTPFPWEERPLVKAMRGEAVDEVEIFVRHSKAPEGMWMSATGRPIIDEDGALSGGVSIFRDITRLKHAEEALALRAEELARSNADLEQFAYVASHDLQEPLRSVMGFAGLLSRRYESKLDGDGRRFITRIVNAASRMQRLIEDLLTYSRVGRDVKEFIPTDCDALVDQEISVLRAAIDESGAVVTHDPLPTLAANDALLGQVFRNLIGNAIKFRGQESPRIHVSAERTEGGWAFSVRDNGIGIDSQYAQRIFTIFQRLHARDEYPGTGIGLAICKKAVERLGGRIWVESQQGQGSTFHFIVPSTPAEESGLTGTEAPNLLLGR